MNDVGYVRIDEQAPTDCAARQVNRKAWECVPCAMAWDDGDDPPACCKLTYARLIDAAMGEAARIEASQHALVAAGLRRYRDQAALQRAMELRKLVELVVKYRDSREAQ